ncbi:MAG: type II toxin-antitoxin system VapC family toxin [Thermomicrobiales bacterium]
MAREFAPDRPPVVVDASLVLKWLLPEELSNRAQALLEAAIRSDRPLVAAPSVPIEVAGAIHDRARREEVTVAEADAAVDLLGRLGLETVAPPELAVEAVTFCRDAGIKGLPGVQAIVLARVINADLWTADSRTYRHAAIAPWMHWLGDFEAL